MSVVVMGAVMQCGPTKRSLRFALTTIAHNADDFGFAVLTLKTIAAKNCCDVRTAMRMVQALEQERWMRVARRVLDGKGSVYLIDLKKLGVAVTPQSRRSPLWREVARGIAAAGWTGDAGAVQEPGRRRPAVVAQEEVAVPESAPRDTPGADVVSGDILSPIDPFLSRESGDISAPPQVTFLPDSGDKTCTPILKNRLNHSLTKYTPQPPVAGGRGGAEVRSEEGKASASRQEADPETERAVRVATEANRVMRDCGFTLGDRRLLRVVTETLQARALAAGEAEEIVADGMITAWRRLQCRAGQLRFVWGPRKFFGEGHWLAEGSWPVDPAVERERASTARRGAEARVGMHVPEGGGEWDAHVRKVQAEREAAGADGAVREDDALERLLGMLERKVAL